MNQAGKPILRPCAAVLLAFVALADVGAEVPAKLAQEKTTTADHASFEALRGPFESGPEVTRACLECHTEAAGQVHESIHWTWEYEHPTTGQLLGKKHVVNNYCGSITTNYARCTSCHVGYGWRDAGFDFSAEENVDCLVCHDTTGSYVKFPTGAGHPPYQDTAFGGKTIEAPDLAEVARNVGKTSRETCGSCHFKGGGGDGVKHGDLDSSLVDPDKSLDVHMDAGGLDFRCSTCHEFVDHHQKGSRYLVKAKSEAGIAVPGRRNDRPACESCHGPEPHPRDLNNRMNTHVDRVACQTCHIPTYARGGIATKTWWDWSVAGELGSDGKPVVRVEDGRVVYDGMKGAFVWEENLVPEYRWFDGAVRYTMLDEPIDPDGVVELNRIVGGPYDPDARIWPFKVMRGVQPYDAVNDVLVIEHLFGKDKAAYWKGFEWGPAIAAGMAEARRIGQTKVAYSGRYAFTRTEMLWPLSHMVAPREEALQCSDCHARDGRMAGLTGFFMPGRDRYAALDRVFGVLLALSLTGVLLHGAARVLSWRRRSTTDPRET